MKPYCVVLCPEPLVNPLSYPRTRCFFLRASTADAAIQTALVDNPQWRVIGIEPSHLLLPLLRTDPSRPTTPNDRAA
jgi:hypothetical protein